MKEGDSERRILNTVEMFTKHHCGMLGKILIDPDRSVILRRGADLGEVQPSAATGRFAITALSEEKDIDHHVGPSIGPEASLRQADRSGKVRHRGDVLACRSISTLSMVPEEVTKAARPPGLRRSIDFAMK